MTTPRTWTEYYINTVDHVCNICLEEDYKLRVLESLDVLIAEFNVDSIHVWATWDGAININATIRGTYSVLALWLYRYYFCTKIGMAGTLIEVSGLPKKAYPVDLTSEKMSYKHLYPVRIKEQLGL